MSADAFVRRIVTLGPGDERPYDPDEWWDAIVWVEAGEVEIECGSGVARFVRGDTLWLTGLPVRALHNRGAEPAVLLAVSRREGPPTAPAGARPGCPRASPPAGPGR